ncbi:MAG TPA: hypothetical protein VGO86_13245, partial [Candidatus Dormibacteraeota bacterium]
MRAALEADGYALEVHEEGGRVGARISAMPEACADCLAPRPVLRMMLQQALGVPEAAIDLRYPG